MLYRKQNRERGMMRTESWGTPAFTGQEKATKGNLNRTARMQEENCVLEGN